MYSLIYSYKKKIILAAFIFSIFTFGYSVLITKVEAQVSNQQVQQDLKEEAPSLIDVAPYQKATVENMLNLAVALGGISLEHFGSMADYAKIFYCEIYQDFFSNDYEWVQISKAIKQQFAKDIDSIGRHYYLITEVNITRYDPANKIFPLEKRSIISQVGEITALIVGNLSYCGKNFPVSTPSSYSIASERPINLYKIPITSQQQLEIISKIPFNKDSVERTLKVAFYYTVDGVIKQKNTGARSNLSFTGTIDRMRVFSDQTYSQLLYEEIYSEPSTLLQ